MRKPAHRVLTLLLLLLGLTCFAGCTKHYVLTYEIPEKLKETSPPADGIKIAIKDLGDRRTSSPSFFCGAANTFGLVPVTWFVEDEDGQPVFLSKFFNTKIREILESQGYENVPIQSMAELSSNEEDGGFAGKKLVGDWINLANEKKADFLILTSLEDCRCFYADWYLPLLPNNFFDAVIRIRTVIIDLRQKDRLVGRKTIRYVEEWQAVWWGKFLLVFGTPLEDALFADGWVDEKFGKQAVPSILSRVSNHINEELTRGWERPLEPEEEEPEEGEEGGIDLDLILLPEDS